MRFGCLCSTFLYRMLDFLVDYVVSTLSGGAKLPTQSRLAKNLHQPSSKHNYICEIWFTTGRSFPYGWDWRGVLSDEINGLFNFDCIR